MKKLLFVFALIVSAIPAHAQVVAPVEPVSLFTACMQTVPASVNYWQAAEYCDVQAARIRDRGLVYGRNYGPVGPVVGFPTSAYGASYATGGFYPNFFLDRCLAGFPKQSQPTKCVGAELKFRIHGGGMNDAEVFIDGYSAGLIDKYSHKLTSGLHLDKDTPYLMEIEWASDQGVKTMVRRIKPGSMDFQDGSYWYPVSKELFDQLPYGRHTDPDKITREEVSGRDLIMTTPK